MENAPEKCVFYQDQVVSNGLKTVEQGHSFTIVWLKLNEAERHEFKGSAPWPAHVFVFEGMPQYTSLTPFSQHGVRTRDMLEVRLICSQLKDILMRTSQRQFTSEVDFACIV